MKDVPTLYALALCAIILLLTEGCSTAPVDPECPEIQQTNRARIVESQIYYLNHPSSKWLKPQRPRLLPGNGLM